MIKNNINTYIPITICTKGTKNNTLYFMTFLNQNMEVNIFFFTNKYLML